jgi:hypothetical protein
MDGHPASAEKVAPPRPYMAIERKHRSGNGKVHGRPIASMGDVPQTSCRRYTQRREILYRGIWRLCLQWRGSGVRWGFKVDSRMRRSSWAGSGPGARLDERRRRREPPGHHSASSAATSPSSRCSEPNKYGKVNGAPGRVATVETRTRRPDSQAKSRHLSRSLSDGGLRHQAENFGSATTSAAIWGTRDMKDAATPCPPLTPTGLRRSVGRHPSGESVSPRRHDGATKRNIRSIVGRFLVGGPIGQTSRPI